MREIKISPSWKLIFFILLLITGACTKEKREVLNAGGPSGPSGPATLSTIQNDIFRLGCAVSGCHDARPSPAAGLSLINANVTYINLLNRNSQQALNVPLIAAGDPSLSYFMAKLTGAHLLMGGSGDTMPQYAAPLKAGDLERIAQWIEDGALNN
jgi:hypothetical protein